MKQRIRTIEIEYGSRFDTMPDLPEPKTDEEAVIQAIVVIVYHLALFAILGGMFYMIYSITPS